MAKANKALMNEEAATTADTCLECGAPAVNGMSCWEQLGAVLGWEWNDPDLQSVHFLTVACHNLQHPAKFTEEAIAWLHLALTDKLVHGTAEKELRRRASSVYNGEKRVLKPEAERKPVLRQWSMTIADVYTPDKPEGAADRVRAWAESIRRDLEQARRKE